MNATLRCIMIACLICTVPAWSAHGESIQLGDELIVNGGFEHEGEPTAAPRGWTRDVMPAGRAEVAIERRHGNDTLRIRFHSPEYVNQARVIQQLTVEPGKVYKLSFRYRTTVSPDLRADVLLTGTGPLYRSYYHAPAAEWTTRRIYFHVPEHEDAKATIYVQNRSAETIWYDDISLRPTNIKADEVDRYQPTIHAQSVSSEDQLLFPDNGKQTADFIYRVEADDEMKPHLNVAAWLLTANGEAVEATVDNERISVDVDKVATGMNRLFVSLVDARDEVQLAYTMLEIERVGDGEFEPGDIDLMNPVVFEDRDGTPVFPIGMYGVGRPTDEQLVELKEAGFNTIHNYGFEGDTGDRMDRHHAFLDQAHEHELKVMVGFPRGMAEQRGRADELAAWIEQLKAHPANLFYTSDEMHIMRHVPRSQFAAVQAMLRKTDPQRRWLIYDIPNDAFAGHVDGIMLVVNSEITAKLVQVRMGEKPVFAVWGQPHYNAARAPSVSDVRYNVFMPVILGSRGWFYWWYPAILHHNEEKELLKERLYESTRLLAKVGPALVSSEEPPAWLDEVQVSGDVRYCHGTLHGTTYLLAGASRGGAGGAVELSLPEGYRVEVMDEDVLGRTRHELAEGEIVILSVTAE